MGKLFNRKKEESKANLRAEKSMHKHRLELNLSRMSLMALDRVFNRMVTDKTGSTLEGLRQQNLDALFFRGAIEQDDAGEYVITEVGKLILALAEATRVLEDKR